MRRFVVEVVVDVVILLAIILLLDFVTVPQPFPFGTERASIAALRGAASIPLPTMSGNAAADQNAIDRLKAEAQATLAQNRPRTVEQTGLLQEDNQAAMEAALERARKAVDMGQASNAQLIDSYYSQMQFVSKRYADERDLALATLDQRDLAQTIAQGVTVAPEPSCPTPSDGPEFCWRDTVTRGNWTSVARTGPRSWPTKGIGVLRRGQWQRS